MKGKIPYEMMLTQLTKMSTEEIIRHFQELGCTWSLAKIIERLSLTYNDLQVSDAIFQKCAIHDENSPYPKDFIDEGVLEIAARQAFPFSHYGILARELQEAQSDKDAKQKVAGMETVFRRMMKMAKQFHLTSLETIQYQANDGLDLIAVLAEMLDVMQQLAKEDKTYAKRIIMFAEKYKQCFPDTNPYTRILLEYEQGQAYITLGSSKGEQLFLKLLKTHGDPSDVVLHYGLAYLDDDPKKTLRIFSRYEKRLDKESDAYAMIQMIRKDVCEQASDKKEK